MTRLTLYSGALMMASMSATAAMAHNYDARDVAARTANELVVTLDNIAEEATELSEAAARRGHNYDAKTLADLADSSAGLAARIDQRLLLPLEHDATLAFARAQLARLAMDFDLFEDDVAAVDHVNRYLAVEIEDARELKYDLEVALNASDRGRPGRDVTIPR